MTRFLATLLIAAAASFAANKKIPSIIAQNLNDRPTIQSAPDAIGGQNDTLFFMGSNPQNSLDSVFSTSVFNSQRNPYIWDGMRSASSVVTANPDSIVCNFMAERVDSDTSDVAFGILYRLSNNLWSSYGGSAGTGGTNVALTKYRVSAPWVGGKGFRPYFVTTTATDTTRVRFVECFSK